MRYIITQSQLHGVVYKYLDYMFKDSSGEKIVNQYNKKAYKINLGDASNEINYFWYGPGEEDDGGNIHYGVGHLQIHPNIVDILRPIMNVRESKVIDIIADWFSEKFNADIDTISIYPERSKPTTY